MWYAMFISLALAGGAQEGIEGIVFPEPPNRPEAAAPVEGECSGAIALVVGKKLPPGLVDEDGNIRCSGVALPNSMYLDLENDRSWAIQLSDRYRYDLGAQAYRYRAIELRLDWANARITQLETPPRWTDRPGVQRWAGRLETLASVAVVGFVVVNLDKLDL